MNKERVNEIYSPFAENAFDRIRNYLVSIGIQAVIREGENEAYRLEDGEEVLLNPKTNKVSLRNVNEMRAKILEAMM